MATQYTPRPQYGGVKAGVQKVGAFLAGMIMPNIGAFIAWGLITALFIEKGRTPNADLAQLVGPMITYLLPILIGYTGGRIVHGQRGAVIGAIATMGVVVGAPDNPMFLGAMIIGPAAAWVLKQSDKFTQEHTPSGFEMLIDNFSLGIIGAFFACIGLKLVSPVVDWFVERASDVVQFMVDHDILPLASVVIEPAKVLFLNNAINHGILTPLGAAQSKETGKSILFMLESNPGAGLGLLTAYLLFGPRELRPSVPAAMIIHFFGGIHEIYFPYVLMKPRLILGMIAGSASGILVFLATDAGLVSAPAPGSIIAYSSLIPKGGAFGVYAGIFTAAVVSFVVNSVLLGFGRGERGTPADENAGDAAATVPAPSQM